MNRIRPCRQFIACSTVYVLLNGCMVGPNYRGPPQTAPVSQGSLSYHRASIAPVTNVPPLALWWLALGDETLNGIEQDALTNSPTLDKAIGKIREARATLRNRRTDLFPSGGVTSIYARINTPSSLGEAISGGGAAGGGNAAPASSADDFDFYNVGLTASWQIDLFGGIRRQIASARDTAQAYEADLQDAQVTLTMNVAAAYVNLRDAQGRLALARQNDAVQERALALTKLQRFHGTASDGSVERVNKQLKQNQADAVSLQGQVEIYTDELSQLAGHEPGALDGVLAAFIPLPVLPAETAVGDPAQLLRRRPDIRAAERRLAAANETIGADIAQYFPTVKLYGTLGYGSTQFSGLIEGANLIKVIAPVLSWNLLNYPQISAQVEGARGSFDQAQASYRSTVLSALLDAENALSRFGYQRENLGRLAEASASATHSAKLADMRFKGGTLSLIDALDVERQRIQAQNNLVQAQASLTTDWVSLQSSLGLGWGSPVMPAQGKQ